MSNSKQSTTDYSFLQLNNQIKTFSFPATEADRGGFGANWMFVKHNRIYQLNQSINVPWTNKDLQIEYMTYREKTLPGSEEKWKIKITGYKKDKVAAEMLASMYDASLDQFYPHNWSEPYIWPNYYNSKNWSGSQNFTQLQSSQKYAYEEESKYVNKNYDFLFYEENDVYGFGLARKISGVDIAYNRAPAPNAEPKEEGEVMAVADSTAIPEKDGDGVPDQQEKEKNAQQDPSVKIRKNFNETAFFLPELRTDSTGAIEFSFSMPEALTKWKFMALAHTKEAAFGSSTKEIITQKELMVQPNAPRFLREGDKMEFSTKVVNLTDKEMTGTAEFQLFDAVTGESVDGWFHNSIANQYFTVAAGQSEALKFPIDIP